MSRDQTAALQSFIISQVFCHLVLLSPGYLILPSVPSSVIFPGRISCKDEFKAKQPVWKDSSFTPPTPHSQERFNVKTVLGKLHVIQISLLPAAQSARERGSWEETNAAAITLEGVNRGRGSARTWEGTGTNRRLFPKPVSRLRLPKTQPR